MHRELYKLKYMYFIEEGKDYKYSGSPIQFSEIPKKIIFYLEINPSRIAPLEINTNERVAMYLKTYIVSMIFCIFFWITDVGFGVSQQGHAFT